MAIRCLAFHAAWRCRHSGACCQAGWSIPIEGTTFERVRIHYRSRDDLFVHEGHMPEGAAAILGIRDGACVFFDRNADERRCDIQRTLGAGSLPLACRQFPRVAMTDRRGTFVTLSHFCPTAAGLLLQPISFDIVEAPGNLALDGDLEGLDASTVLPPLLRPNLLTDLDGYDAWERLAIRTLANDRLSSGQAAGTIELATKWLEHWTPGTVSLRDAVVEAFDRTVIPDAELQLARATDLFTVVSNSVPSGLDRPRVPQISQSLWMQTTALVQHYDRAVRAWLAARLFGNWMAYSAPGLRVVAASLQAWLSVLRVEACRIEQDRPDLAPERRFVEAIRKSDLMIVHLSDVRSLTPLLARLA
jgi:Fe-S-cluster containining protein